MGAIKPFILQICGYKNTGKTTFLNKLVKHITLKLELLNMMDMILRLQIIWKIISNILIVEQKKVLSFLKINGF